MLANMFRMLLWAYLIMCLQAANLMPLIQTVTNCDNMTKPYGLPEVVWSQLKPKLCQGNGKVTLQDAPEICAEINGNQQHHPSCQVWKRKQMSKRPNAIMKPESTVAQDHQLVLDCLRVAWNELMHKHKYSQDVNSACQSVVTKQIGFSSGRTQDSLAYLYELSQFLSQIDQCLEMAEQMALELPSNCTFLDAHELVEHCFMYHQFDRYASCENISWPRISQPTDVKTMYMYSVWTDISFDFEQQLEEYRMGMEGNPDPMAVVMYCLHNATWTDDSNHHCFNVTKPQKNVLYTAQDRLYQKMYHQKRQDELRYDCLKFHKNEKLSVCKFITWR